MANTFRGLLPDGTLPSAAEAQVRGLIESEAPAPDLSAYPTVSEVETMIEEQGPPVGTVPIWPTMAEAEAWEAANPGSKALTIEAQDPDVTPPVPGTLAVTVADISATLTVTGASDDRAVAGFSFRVGTGDWTPWQVGNTATIPGLSPSTPYSFQHRVRDAAYNISLGTPVPQTTSAMTQKSPSQIGSLWGHWDASVASSVTKDGTAVSAWTDRTSNARELVQADTGKQPHTVTMGGLTALQFVKAATEYMRYQPPGGFTIDVAVGYTLCWIGRWDTSGLGEHVASIADGASISRRSPDGLIQNGGVPLLDGPASAIPADGEVVFVAASIQSGGPSVLRVSGVSGKTNSTIPPNNPGTAMDVGRSVAGLYSNSTTGEVWVHDRALTTSELDALRMYAQAKWGAT